MKTIVEMMNEEKISNKVKLHDYVSKLNKKSETNLFHIEAHGPLVFDCQDRFERDMEELEEMIEQVFQGGRIYE